MKQATIKQSVSIEGKGLHTGLEIHLTIHPAPVDTGICFRRTDLEGQPCYEALVGYVTGTSRGTIIENGKWKISTIEHLMSAVYAMGITNCVIDTDATEVPILDGSALPYIEAIRKAGVEQQQKDAKEWVVTERIELDNGKGSRMVIEPCDRFEAKVTVDYDSPVLHIQEAEISKLEDYPVEVAAARTFCFLREIEFLLHLGLIKGGDLQNALVIYDKKVSQWGLNRLADKLGQPRQENTQLGYLSPLHYDNEPARHKLLDLMGDMALLGVRIKGRIEAYKPGHGFNTWCGKQIYGKW